MRQFDQAAVQAFLRESTASDAPRCELAAADGSRLVFERAPAPGVTEVLTEVSPDGTRHVHTRAFAAAASAPPAYPAGAPFVPGRAVTVVDLGGVGNSSLTWEGVEVGSTLADDLVRASLADGWREAPPVTGALGALFGRAASAAARVLTGVNFGLRVLERGGRRRVVQVTARAGRPSAVMLFESPTGPGARAGSP